MTVLDRLAAPEVVEVISEDQEKVGRVNE